MATEQISGLPTVGVAATSFTERPQRSVFNLPAEFFDSCRLLSSSVASAFEPLLDGQSPAQATLGDADTGEGKISGNAVALNRWTCNACKAEFESLQEQRSHFKSDIHRLNIKLSTAGKDIVKEEDFDGLTLNSFEDYEVSSISGSEDEADPRECTPNGVKGALVNNLKQKLFICLRTGERLSVWKPLILNDSESVSFDNDKEVSSSDSEQLSENEVVGRLRYLVQETPGNRRLRIVLLASAGHFAGCAFDGNTVVAHKTFHRYVVRAKAGKKQSSKDASGKSAHSAGASLRRYNELALKKEIQELLTAWKPYFDASSCVFMHVPSNSRQIFFNGDKPYFSHQLCAIRNIPFTIRRPTFKEALRVYHQLMGVVYEVEAQRILSGSVEDSLSKLTVSEDGSIVSRKPDLMDKSKCSEAALGPANEIVDDVSSESGNEGIQVTTPLHEAAKSGISEEVLELLEQGLDPCSKDERGRTPYMLANEKEVRNTFRRFMAANLDKWDWHAAKVPSALTKEMEESQAAKQAEKDAKRKARAKELKKLRRAKEKKAQAGAASSQNAGLVADNRASVSLGPKGIQLINTSQLSKEEELKKLQAAEREKRAAAAERRIAAAAAATKVSESNPTTIAASSSQTKSGPGSEITCSCCNTSLAGKVPFHRYNYKYCSTSCMHVHRELLEDG